MYTQELLTEKLQKFRQLPTETEWLEFKEAKETFGFEDIGLYFSALSNEANLKRKDSALLKFGITNRSPRKNV